MFPQILVATDLSPASLEVVNCVGGLWTLGVQTAVLAHCLNTRHLGHLGDQIKEFIQPTLEDQRQIMEKQGIATTIDVVLGPPQIEINRVAREKNCSLIVIGSHGHSLWSETLLGEVASAVLHHASLPVLVIRLKIHERDGQATCEAASRDLTRHILFPTDFSDNAEHAFSYVENLVAESGVKCVTLMHVQDKVRIEKHLEHRLNEFNQIDRGRLERLKEKLQEKGATDVRIEQPYGSPVKEILKQTKEAEVSLVVMGSQGRGFISEVFLGSVSHNVARHAPVSVLLIPAIR